MSKKSKKGSGPIPLLVPDDMRSKVRTLAEKSGLTDAAIMRLAIERGLGSVERMFEPDPEPVKKAA